MDFDNKITDVLPLPACIFNSEKKTILSANAMFATLTGFKANEAMPAWFVSLAAQWQQAAGNFSAQAVTVITHKESGNKITAVVHAKNFGNDNNGQSYLVTFSPVPYIESNTAEAKANNALELLTKETDEFIYAASHDLQEPLRKIATFSGRLTAALGDDMPEDAAMYLKRMNVAADNMRDLINSLLEVSRVDKNMQAEPEVDLQTIATEVLQSLTRQAEEKNAKITVENMPAIEAVAVQMQQLFFHLISNAIKFAKADVEPQIHIYSRPLNILQKQQHHLADDKAYHMIIFADNGIGFEQQYAEKIFKIFTRLNGKSEYKGAGVGLAVCKKIVDKHNGIITAISQENEGSIFTVILPENQKDI